MVLVRGVDVDFSLSAEWASTILQTKNKRMEPTPRSVFVDFTLMGGAAHDWSFS
jgi:hypothetical protein